MLSNSWGRSNVSKKGKTSNGTAAILARVWWITAGLVPCRMPCIQSWQSWVTGASNCLANKFWLSIKANLVYVCVLSVTNLGLITLLVLALLWNGDVSVGSCLQCCCFYMAKAYHLVHLLAGQPRGGNCQEKCIPCLCCVTSGMYIATWLSSWVCTTNLTAIMAFVAHCVATWFFWFLCSHLVLFAISNIAIWLVITHLITHIQPSGLGSNMYSQLAFDSFCVANKLCSYVHV